MSLLKKLAAGSLAGVFACAMLLGISGCERSGAQSKSVRLAYVNWDEGVAVSHLLEIMLTDMGYEVQRTMADVAPIFASIARGNQDVMVETWVPVTHQAYWKQFEGQFEDIGTWYENARIGLVVPAYVEANSIDDLKQQRAAFAGKITGIDSGAGIMQTTEKAIAEYDLGYDLVTSSGPAMTAALKSAIDKKQPIVVTGWAPHWKFARYDLKFLEDTKGIYGGEEEVKFIARNGFSADRPELAAFFGKIKFDSKQIGSLMDALSQADGNEAAAVREWMKQNQALVDSWK